MAPVMATVEPCRASQLLAALLPMRGQARVTALPVAVSMIEPAVR